MPVDVVKMQEQMFGMQLKELVTQVEDCMFVKLEGPHNGRILEAISWLSDAQESMARGNDENARQFINCAKFMLTQVLDQLEDKGE